MLHPFWPLFDLSVRTPTLLLRPLTEQDARLLAERLPDDVTLDPAATRFAGIADRRQARGVAVQQHYWRSWATWTPEGWRLGFGVWSDGELVGLQELEGTDFPTVRTVGSASYLLAVVRGRGVGREMRRAVLALAFGPLGAEAAVSSAWWHNEASLRVSRALGYQPNGESLHRRDDGDTAPGPDTMVHLRLLRRQWLHLRLADGVEIQGFEPCRPFFGL